MRSLPSDHALSAARRFRRALAWLVIGAYLATTAFFAGCHLLGDSLGTRWAYGFTWDMFPWHYSESTRRFAVGRTTSRRILQLAPSGLLQFRGGVRGDLPRNDLDRRGVFFRSTVEQVLSQTRNSSRGDPIEHVWLIEEYWPAKFNLPDDLYYLWTGTEKPRRRYWRLREEFDVATEPSTSLRQVGP